MQVVREQPLQLEVILVHIFKILLNFVKSSNGVLLAQLAVTELLLQLSVLSVQSCPELALIVLLAARGELVPITWAVRSV